MKTEDEKHLIEFATGTRSSTLVGVISMQDCTPKDGQSVIWLWDSAGQITAGDYFAGKCRDAATNYVEVSAVPTHWMPWPDNWPTNTEKCSRTMLPMPKFHSRYYTKEGRSYSKTPNN